MPVYELHEVTSMAEADSIDLSKTDSVKFNEYSVNEQGTFILDKNKDLTFSRRLINLNVAKVSQAKFNQIIGIDFEDFTENVNDPTRLLESKIQLLEQDRSKILATSNTDKDKILKLQKEIDNLRAQLALLNAANTPNKVPDTLTAKNVLYADRDGKIGSPGYPEIQNKLLSKNRMAVGIIQNDGNFVIYSGNFDEFGNEILNFKIDEFGNKVFEPSELTVVTAFGWNELNDSVPALRIFVPEDNSPTAQLEVIRTNPYANAWGSGRQKLSNAARIVLDDSGVLTLYDGQTAKWSSYGLEVTGPLRPGQTVSDGDIGFGAGVTGQGSDANFQAAFEGTPPPLPGLGP